MYATYVVVYSAMTISHIRVGNAHKIFGITCKIIEGEQLASHQPFPLLLQRQSRSRTPNLYQPTTRVHRPVITGPLMTHLAPPPPFTDSVLRARHTSPRLPLSEPRAVLCIHLAIVRWPDVCRGWFIGAGVGHHWGDGRPRYTRLTGAVLDGSLMPTDGRRWEVAECADDCGDIGGCTGVGPSLGSPGTAADRRSNAGATKAAGRANRPWLVL